MATPQDASVGLGLESTYKTAVTPTRWFEVHGDESLDYNPTIVQGQGLRVGRRVALSGRRVVPDSTAGGDITLDAISQGMGLLWQGCLGAGSSTLVSGSTFQQVFTLGDSPPSLTFQKSIFNAGTGAMDPITFPGCMISQFTLTAPNADIATLQFSVTSPGASVTTATALTAPSSFPPATASLFHFANGSIASGTLTAPTTTALASGTTTLADVRSAVVSVNNNLNDRPNFGGRQKPTVGLREITGTLTAEYDTVAYRDAFLAQTPAMLILNYTGAALSSGVEQLQVVIPEYKLDGSLPNANGADLITTDFNFTGLDNLTAAQPIWIVCRTKDTAL